MNKNRYWILWLSVILLIVVGFIISAQGIDVESSSEQLIGPVDVYYPIDVTEQIKYDYRVRPFDTDVTLEGIGWQDGKMIAVLKSVVHAQQNIVSHAPKRLTPRVTYQGKTFPLNQLLWDEGSEETYKTSVYRYAVSSPEAKEIPQGRLPDVFAINEGVFKLPKTFPKEMSLPSKQRLTAKVGSIAKEIKSGGLTYRVEEVNIRGDQRVVKMKVNAIEDSDETSGFILRDDQERIYTFEPSSLPHAYKSGDNEVDLRLLQSIPADATHLSLVMFETEMIQPGLNSLLGEVEIPLF